MLTGGPNYIMIRGAIFGKVHGHAVKEIWLISQFPARHTDVASGAKIVFAGLGLARLFGTRSWSYKQWVHHLLYSLLAPKWLHFAFQRSISYFLTLSNQNLCPWCNTGGEQVYKQSREKHHHFKTNSSGCRGKKWSLKYQNKMSFQISLCDRSKIIINQNEW